MLADEQNRRFFLERSERLRLAGHKKMISSCATFKILGAFCFSISMLS